MAETLDSLNVELGWDDSRFQKGLSVSIRQTQVAGDKISKTLRGVQQAADKTRQKMEGAGLSGVFSPTARAEHAIDAVDRLRDGLRLRQRQADDFLDALRERNFNNPPKPLLDRTLSNAKNGTAVGATIGGTLGTIIGGPGGGTAMGAATGSIVGGGSAAIATILGEFLDPKTVRGLEKLIGRLDDLAARREAKIAEINKIIEEGAPTPNLLAQRLAPHVNQLEFFNKLLSRDLSQLGKVFEGLHQELRLRIEGGLPDFNGDPRVDPRSSISDGANGAPDQMGRRLDLRAMQVASLNTAFTDASASAQLFGDTYDEVLDQVLLPTTQFRDSLAGIESQLEVTRSQAAEFGLSLQEALGDVPEELREIAETLGGSFVDSLERGRGVMDSLQEAGRQAAGQLLQYLLQSEAVRGELGELADVRENVLNQALNGSIDSWEDLGRVALEVLQAIIEKMVEAQTVATRGGGNGGGIFGTIGSRWTPKADWQSPLYAPAIRAAA